MTRPPAGNGRIAAIVPVLDEAGSIQDVVNGLLINGACCVVVVDGGSSDGTGDLATQAGARVVLETRPGYGRACRTGGEVALAADHAHAIVAFLDGDGSCDPTDLPTMVAPLLTPGERADLVLGVRPNGLLEAGAMPWHARLGNAAVAAVLALRTGRHPWDLSPWKALRADTLRGLELDADGYAWTVQLVARALRRRDVAVVRRAVWFRRRSAGRSKVSGSWRSSLRAGGEMLFAALSETRRRPIIALVAKPAEPGLVKTRLAASIGNQAAAEFWRASLGDLGERLGQLARRHGYDPVAVVPSSAAVEPVREIVGPAWQVIAQAEPGLAGALRGIFSDAGRAGAPSAVVIAGDNPTLPTDYILRAFEAVRGGGRAVLGPAFDGGYYLVGMSTHRPPRPRRGKGEGHNLAAIFRDEAMGTSSAGASARQALGGWSDRLTVLAPWLDVDTIDDLRRLAEAAWDGVIAPRTAAWLRAWQADAPPMMSDAGSVPSSP